MTRTPFDKWVVEVTNHELHELPKRLHGYLHTAWAEDVPVEDARVIHAEHKQRDRAAEIQPVEHTTATSTPEDFELVTYALSNLYENALEAFGRIRSKYDAMRTELLTRRRLEKDHGYDQGFRDALLTVKALVTTLRTGELQHGPLNHLGRHLDALIDRLNVDLWQLFAVAEVDLSAHPEAEALRAMLRAPTGLLIDSAGRMLFVRLNGTEYDTGVLALLEKVAQLTAAAESKPASDHSLLTGTLRDAMKQAEYLTKAGLGHISYARAGHCRDQISSALDLAESLLAEVAQLKAAAQPTPPPELMTITINDIHFRVEKDKPLAFEVLTELWGFGQVEAISYHGKGRLGEFSGTLTAGGSLVVPPDTVFRIG